MVDQSKTNEEIRAEIAASMARVNAIRARRGHEIETALDAIPDTHIRRHTYGQRGGDGPNTGKKASKYQGTLPDGRVVTKRSFNIHTETALLRVYQHQGVWECCGPFADKTSWPDGTYITAQKVS